MLVPCGSEADMGKAGEVCHLHVLYSLLTLHSVTHFTHILIQILHYSLIHHIFFFTKIIKVMNVNNDASIKTLSGHRKTSLSLLCRVQKENISNASLQISFRDRHMH